MFRVLVSPALTLTVLTVLRYPMNEKVRVCSPADTAKVYCPSKLVKTPLPDAVITVAEGKALPWSSVTRPCTAVWAMATSQDPQRRNSEAKVAIRIMRVWIEGVGCNF